MSRSVRDTVIAVLLLCGLSPAASISQESLPRPDDLFYGSVDVNVVNVEAVVTDRKGRRVTDLTRDDFVVYEDGKPVEVQYFYASKGAGLQPGREPERERLHLAVYWDVEELPAYTRPRLIAAVQSFVTSRSRPGDTVLIGSYHGADTNVVRQVPVEPAPLAAALQEVMDLPMALITDSEDLGLIAMNSGLRTGGSGKLGEAMGALEDADILAERASRDLRVRVRTKTSFVALEQFLAALASLPGRKALLYVGANVTFESGQSIFQIFERKVGPGLARGPLRRWILELEEQANSDRILFHAIGARDLMARATFVDPDRDRIDDHLETALADIGEDLDSYYSLGYTPGRREPGKLHKVEVRVKRPGLRVRSLESFRERGPDDRAQSRTIAALLFGGGENPLGLSLEIGAAEKEEKGQVIVPVTVLVPLSAVTLLPGKDGSPEGRLTIFVAARDAEGRMSEITERQVSVRPDKPPSPDRKMSCTLKLALRPLSHTVAVDVRDELGKTLSTVTALLGGRISE